MGKGGQKRTVLFWDKVYAHDDSAEYGKDPKNPIQLANIIMAYIYLDSLYFEDGTDVVYARVATFKTDTGHTMDSYVIMHEGSESVVCDLYFDCYVPTVTPRVPEGFRLKIGDCFISAGERVPASWMGPGPETGNVDQVTKQRNQGCALPFILMFGVVVYLGTVFAKMIMN